MTESATLSLLAAEARAYITPAVVAELPCESFRSAHWHRIARVWPFDLFARTEPDHDAFTGAEQIALIVELRHAGERINGAALRGIQTPDCAVDWAPFYVELAEVCRVLIGEATHTSTVRRYLEERLLTAQDLLKATYEIHAVAV
jgi:hypothetical protein